MLALGIIMTISDGIVKREDIFITLKLYPSSDNRSAIIKILKALVLDDQDLLLIYEPRFDDMALYKEM